MDLRVARERGGLRHGRGWLGAATTFASRNVLGQGGGHLLRFEGMPQESSNVSAAKVFGGGELYDRDDQAALHLPRTHRTAHRRRPGLRGAGGEQEAGELVHRRPVHRPAANEFGQTSRPPHHSANGCVAILHLDDDRTILSQSQCHHERCARRLDQLTGDSNEPARAEPGLRQASLPYRRGLPHHQSVARRTECQRAALRLQLVPRAEQAVAVRAANYETKVD